MSCNIYNNGHLLDEIIRAEVVDEEITDLSKQPFTDKNVIEVREETDEIAYVDQLILEVNGTRIKIVKKLYLDIGQKFEFPIFITERLVTVMDFDPIEYIDKLEIKFICNGKILEVAPGDYRDEASASAAKAEVERTTPNTVKYVTAFRPGKDPGFSDTYLRVEDSVYPVLVVR
jgi:glycerol-3-phosphate cytidylyltransferase-like family protein